MKMLEMPGYGNPVNYLLHLLQELQNVKPNSNETIQRPLYFVTNCKIHGGYFT